MQPRTQLIDLFSAFALLEGDYFRKWVLEPRLRRSMEASIANASESVKSDNVWAIYWHRQWQNQDARWAEQHLTAYLQESCYWVARTLVRRLSSTQYTTADCFQIANSEIRRVLQHFSPDRGSSLKSYASFVLTNILKDMFRQRQAADICSDWALLRKVSKKRIKDVLLNTGVVEPETAQYQFSWVCFQALYVPSETTGGQLPQVSRQFWEEVATLYNTKRLGQLVVPGNSLTGEQLESRLYKLSRWVRTYLYPDVDSLNRSKPGQEVGEMQDDLTDPLFSQNLLDQELEREEIEQRVNQKGQLQTILIKALEELEPELQEILRLFYQQNMSQQDLASHLQLSQPTVSRRIKKAEEKLLGTLLNWRQSQLNQFPDPNELKDISIGLREWLAMYYDSPTPQNSI
jgi:RNA polymerase sigma factor (sigma-70 family)